MATSRLSPLWVRISNHGEPESLWPYLVFFFISGFPALLYQIVWQRALFTIYGVNIESVTVIVSVFMLGLGLGSLAGGRLSALSGIRSLRAFGMIEISIGAFGFSSLWLFHRVAQFTAGKSTAETGIITFLLLLVPTLLMGSTLPLLVAHLVQRTENVGESVASLYAANTFGSAAACFLASLFLMHLLGESGSIRLAASMNFLVGLGALLIQIRNRSASLAPSRSMELSAAEHEAIPFGVGMILAAATGFLALAYEILWYRIYSFTGGCTPECFARLLAAYLFGVAYGALQVRDFCKQKLRNDLKRTLWTGSTVVMLGTITAYLLGPAVALSVRLVPYDATFEFVAIAAALLGASFPIFAHAAIGPTEQSGKKLSYLYLSNIVGSALGSFVIGFVVLDRWSTSTASLLLLGLGFIVAAILAALAKPVGSKTMLACAFAVCVILAASSHFLFSKLYERLLFKNFLHRGIRLVNLVENRSGVIAVDSNETVWGGGAYDGHFNIDPMNDTNGIYRAYAIAGLHPDPKRVLIIGLSSGSWAQIVANLPKVEEVTIVEINPGYLPLIRQRSDVSSLLQNPKVHIVIDDGRRWLVSHPDRRFDFILINTPLHWQANTSNLLSVDFLRLIRRHLNSNGIEYYNTTESEEAELTGATVFPYALRISNFLAVSDSPFVFDRALLKSILMAYTIDGRLVFDLSNPIHRVCLERIVSLPEATREDMGVGLDRSIEVRSSLLKRLKGLSLVTDDNMGTEWR